MSTMAALTKKSFEFRMSKKVAELTQVVHMLFTRNHEKEVELESLREAYEYEIELVLKDARSKIDSLQKEIKSLDSDQANSSEKHRLHLEQAVLKRDEEWKNKYEMLDKLYQDEKKECQNHRDLLIQSQKDIESLRRSQSEDHLKKSQDTKNRSKEIENMKNYINTLEKKLRDQHLDTSGTINEFKKMSEKYQKELSQCKELMGNAEKNRELIVAKLKQQEAEIRGLRKELSKRISTANSRQDAAAPAFTAIMHHDEEVEKLKKELQRYRMELSNRENNFNRMFTSNNTTVSPSGKQLVKSNKQIAKIGADPFQQSPAYLGLENEPTFMKYSREKTYFAKPSRSAHSEYYEDALFDSSLQAPSPRHPPQFLEARLPQLTFETKPKMPNLMKPKPLSRDMLSSKSVN